MDQNHNAGADAPGADDAFVSDLLNEGAAAETTQNQQTEARTEPVVERPTTREPERIPLPEYLSERERRQTLEKRVAEFEAAEKKRLEEAQRNQSVPDVFADPDAFRKHQEDAFKSSLSQQEQAFRKELLTMRLDMDQRFVRSQDPEGFEAAFKWFSEQVSANPGLYQVAVGQPSPHGWMIDQFKQSKLVSEIGNDPEAYRKKLLEEALSDPEYVARAAEKAREMAAGNVRFQSSPQAAHPQQQRTALPSMRTAGAAAPTGGRSSEQSGDDLLDEVFSAA